MGKAGRPREYDRTAIAALICERLSHGEPMTKACDDLGVPVRRVNDWRHQDPSIAQQFDDARDLGFDVIAHDCMVIADNTEAGEETEYDEKGVAIKRKVGDMLGHRKLRVDTRLKLLAKWDPRRYGDKTFIAGDKENPLVVERSKLDLSDAELLAVARGALKSAAESDG